MTNALQIAVVACLVVHTADRVIAQSTGSNDRVTYERFQCAMDYLARSATGPRCRSTTTPCVDIYSDMYHAMVEHEIDLNMLRMTSFIAATMYQTQGYTQFFRAQGDGQVYGAGAVHMNLAGLRASCCTMPMMREAMMTRSLWCTTSVSTCGSPVCPQAHACLNNLELAELVAASPLLSFKTAAWFFNSGSAVVYDSASICPDLNRMGDKGRGSLDPDTAALVEDSLQCLATDGFHRVSCCLFGSAHTIAIDYASRLEHYDAVLHAFAECPVEIETVAEGGGGLSQWDKLGIGLGGALGVVLIGYALRQRDERLNPHGRSRVVETREYSTREEMVEWVGNNYEHFDVGELPDDAHRWPTPDLALYIKTGLFPHEKSAHDGVPLQKIERGMTKAEIANAPASSLESGSTNSQHLSFAKSGPPSLQPDGLLSCGGVLSWNRKAESLVDRLRLFYAVWDASKMDKAPATARAYADKIPDLDNTLRQKYGHSLDSGNAVMTLLERLRSFYTVWCPAKLELLPTIARLYVGKEAELDAELRHRYGHGLEFETEGARPPPDLSQMSTPVRGMPAAHASGPVPMLSHHTTPDHQYHQHPTPHHQYPMPQPSPPRSNTADQPSTMPIQSQAPRPSNFIHSEGGDTGLKDHTQGSDFAPDTLTGPHVGGSANVRVTGTVVPSGVPESGMAFRSHNGAAIQPNFIRTPRPTNWVEKE